MMEQCGIHEYWIKHFTGEKSTKAKTSFKFWNEPPIQQTIFEMRLKLFSKVERKINENSPD